MSVLIDSTVYDGDKAIARVSNDRDYYRLTPLDGSGWSKSMGKEIDHDYIAGMFACSLCDGCATPETYMEPSRSEMLTHRLCFACNHWRGIVDADAGAAKNRAVIIDGKHYYIGENKAQDHHRWAGFGGDVFNIEFYDGRKVRCNNLWSQGGIPKHWRDKLPDNAVFAERAK